MEIKTLYLTGEAVPVSEEVEKKLKNAWPVHNMEAHEAQGRKLWYIGFYKGYMTDKKSITCFFEDEYGDMWHEERVLLSDGRIVNSQVFFFGKERNRPKIENDCMVPRRWESE